jgi:DNA-binding winged helix-turn-helix (wHTH) protein
MSASYLGDGVYATINKKDPDYPVVITTGTHDIKQAESVIYFEKAAIELLIILYQEQDE